MRVLRLGIYLVWFYIKVTYHILVVSGTKSCFPGKPLYVHRSEYIRRHSYSWLSSFVHR